MWSEGKMKKAIAAVNILRKTLSNYMKTVKSW